MANERKYYGQGHKSFVFEGCKALDEGHGRITGHGSLLYTPDRGAEIIIGYDDVDEFVKSGFMSDTHGRRAGEVGKHTMSDTIGLIEDAKVDSRGLWVDASFHSDQPSQDIRTKVKERMDKNKDVPLSIGYKVTAPPIYVHRSDYGKELPRFIPKEFLSECLEGCKAFSQVKLIRVAPFEISTVPRAMHGGALAEGAKSDMSVIQITKEGFKADFLGTNIEMSIAWQAICVILDRLRWYILDVVYSADEIAEKTEKISGACRQAEAIIAELTPKILETKEMATEGMKAFISPQFEQKVGEATIDYKALIEKLQPTQEAEKPNNHFAASASLARFSELDTQFNQLLAETV